MSTSYNRPLDEKRIKRIERHLKRRLLSEEIRYTIVKMPLSLAEYRAFFITCFMTPKMINRQNFTGKNLSWRKHLVDGQENWLMVWLIGEITGRMRAGAEGDERRQFFSKDDNYISFHNAIECFSIDLGVDKFPHYTKLKYYNWRKECIEMGLILPVQKSSEKVFVNPNFFTERISNKKKRYLVKCFNYNLFFMPIKDELIGYVMGESRIIGKPLAKSYIDLNKKGLSPLFKYYTSNSLCCQAFYKKNYVDLNSTKTPVSILEVV